MRRAIKPASPELVTDWYPGDTAPVREGWYERKFSDGVFTHWWDGKLWFADGRDGKPHTVPHWRQVGDYPVWRGARRWVLQGPADNLLSIIASKPVVIYLEDARPRSAKWSSLAKARPFRTEAAAQRFAARYSRLGLTAVMP